MVNPLGITKQRNGLMAFSGLKKSEGGGERYFLTPEEANGSFCHACLMDVDNEASPLVHRALALE
jgi:hypothetical protein